MTTSVYDFWYHWTSHPNIFDWAGTYLVLGMAPDGTDIILMYGPQPA